MSSKEKRTATRSRGTPTILDKCLTTAEMNFTLVEFQGRGHEHFSDEILRLFDWMGRLKRDFARKSSPAIDAPWDNFFWWVEVLDLPPKTMVDPDNWPLPSAPARPRPTPRSTPTTAFT